MVFHTSIVNWCVEGVVHVCSVYVHFAICETYLMYWYSIDLLSTGVGGICILSICPFCYMWNLLSVTVFHTSIVHLSGG